MYLIVEVLLDTFKVPGAIFFKVNKMNYSSHMECWTVRPHLALLTISIEMIEKGLLWNKKA